MIFRFTNRILGEYYLIWPKLTQKASLFKCYRACIFCKSCLHHRTDKTSICKLIDAWFKGSCMCLRENYYQWQSELLEFMEYNNRNLYMYNKFGGHHKNNRWTQFVSHMMLNILPWFKMKCVRVSMQNSYLKNIYQRSCGDMENYITLKFWCKKFMSPGK